MEKDWKDINKETPVIDNIKGVRYTQLFEVRFEDGSAGKVLYGNSGFSGEGNGWFSHGLPKFTHFRNI